MSNANAVKNYQPKGTYQPAGNYQPAGTYLTSINKSNSFLPAKGTNFMEQPSDNYLTSVMANYNYVTPSTNNFALKPITDLNKVLDDYGKIVPSVGNVYFYNGVNGGEGGANNTLSYDPNTGLINLPNKVNGTLCLTDGGSSITSTGSLNYANYGTALCNPNDINQKFYYNPQTLQLTMRNKPGLCLDSITKPGLNNIGNNLCNPLSQTQKFVMTNRDYATKSYVNNTYLSQANATANYLSQANATANYLSQANATANYLSQANAKTTYQPIGTYPTQDSNDAKYLSKTDASNTYATQANLNKMMISIDQKFDSVVASLR